MQRRRRESESSGPLTLGQTAATVLLALLVWMIGDAPASAQISGADYDRAIEGVCRGYAAAVTTLPSETAFTQCMRNRECRVLPGSSTYHCPPPQPTLTRGSN